MRVNAVSIRILNPPVLTPSDIENRQSSQASTSKENSRTSINAQILKIRNENQKNIQFNRKAAPVKYFSRVSRNISKIIPPNTNYKKTLYPNTSFTFNFTQKRRFSAPNELKQIRFMNDVFKKPQGPRPTQLPSHTNQNQQKFLEIIKEALRKQAENKISKDIDTDSDEESSRRISTKKMINCFTIDQFEKGKLLGKGQFGQVYIVKHKQTGFICALKILDKEYIVKQKLQVQIAKEIKLHSTLQHPNINQMYGFSWDEKHIYLLMELCSDGQVFKILKKRRRTSEKQAAYIIKQMVEAVNYMHSINVIHRDLKPQNMIMHEGLIKVIDFGWATDYKGKHRTTLCGTPLYYSPEMVKKQSYDFNVDLWAIGIMAYQLLIGNIPFSIWTEMELHKIVKDDIKFPSYVEVSEAAKSFILSILHKTPEKRMQLSDILSHDFLKDVNVMDFVDLFAEE